MLQNHHLAHLAIVARLYLVEIDAAGDRLTVLIFSIPMDGLLPTLIATHPLPSQIHLSHQDTFAIVDVQPDLGFLSQVERYPGLRVERVGIVLLLNGSGGKLLQAQIHATCG